MAATPRTLLSAGGLYETMAPVHRPRSTEELASLLANARRRGKRLTLIGAGRSFGRHFFPPAGVHGVDTTALCGTVTALEPAGDGLWVRVPGSHTFEQLWRDVPGYLPQHPPTSDRVTVAGALVSCGHNTSGFFAEGVRAFRVMTPDGSTLDCRPDGGGHSAALFDCVPGSFGALGVILEVELFLRRLVVDERAEISVIDRLPSLSHRALDCLDAHLERGALRPRAAPRDALTFCRVLARCARRGGPGTGPYLAAARGFGSVRRGVGVLGPITIR